MKKILTSVAALLLVMILGEITLQVSNFRTRQRAENLIAELRTLKLGVSLQDVQPVLTKYNADQMSGANCSRQGVAYSIVISNPMIEGIALNHPWLLKVGVRPVGFSANLTFVDDHLCELLYTANAVIAGGQYPRKAFRIQST